MVYFNIILEVIIDLRCDVISKFDHMITEIKNKCTRVFGYKFQNEHKLESAKPMPRSCTFVTTDL